LLLRRPKKKKLLRRGSSVLMGLRALEERLEEGS
jgi:hypothetical protein